MINLILVRSTAVHIIVPTTRIMSAHHCEPDFCNVNVSQCCLINVTVYVSNAMNYTCLMSRLKYGGLETSVASAEIYLGKYTNV